MTQQLFYDSSWRARLQQFYTDRNETRYWAFNFERLWRKFARGVQQELELAHLVSHWLDFSRARVLVIGSYLGAEAIAYAQCGARVIGIDLDRPAMEMARDRALLHGANVDFRLMDAGRTTFADGSFDYVSCAQVLEHLPPKQQPKMLAEIWRLVKPGGLFWIDTPNQLALMDHHDTGLPLIHWLPRVLKVPLARMLGRTFPFEEPAFNWEQPLLHYYLSYPALKRALARLGRFEVLSRYRGYADADHYAESRGEQGRTPGALKMALLRGMLKVWDFNRFAGMRLVIRKAAQVVSQMPARRTA